MRKKGIGSLPDDLLLHILKIFLVDSNYHFGQLAKLRLVCRRFKSLASSNVLWKYLFPYSSQQLDSPPGGSWYKTAIQMETGSGGMDYGVFRGFLTVVNASLEHDSYEFDEYEDVKGYLDKGGCALKENFDLFLFLMKHIDSVCLKYAGATLRSH